MKLCKKITNIIEKHGFTVNEVEEQDKEYYVEFGQHTPEGEDWWETIWFNGTQKDFVNGVERRYENFDVDEEVEIWIESRGKRGVPSSIKALVEDAEWKENMLKTLFEDLDKLKL